MSEKQKLRRRIWELDFALHELVLFLDTHPDCKKALALKADYLKMRKKAIAAYTEKYGPLNLMARKTDGEDRWEWIEGPWPWENSFAEV